MGGDEPLIVLIHREEIVVVARPFGRIPLQLMDHGAGGYFLIRLAQLQARLAERRIGRVFRFVT